MKNNIYFLIRSLLISLLFFLLLPFHSFAQGPFSCPNDCSGHGTCLPFGSSCICSVGWSGSDCSIPTPTPTPTSTPTNCPNDCSGHGSCNSDGSCSCGIEWAGSDCLISTSSTPSTPKEEAIQAVQDNIQNATDLDNQALQKIDEGDYPSVPPIISDATKSLTDAKDSLKTEPDLEQLREDEPSALSKIERSLQSSINNHKKASSTIDRIVNDPKVTEDEGLLSTLLKKAKKFLSDAINRERKAGRAIGVVTSVRG